MKICPVGAELFLADRRRDRRTVMTELIVAFRNFAEAPRNSTGFGIRWLLFWVSQCPYNPKRTTEIEAMGTMGRGDGGRNVRTSEAISCCWEAETKKAVSTILNTSCTLRVLTMFLLRWFCHKEHETIKGRNTRRNLFWWSRLR